MTLTPCPQSQRKTSAIREKDRSTQWRKQAKLNLSTLTKQKQESLENCPNLWFLWTTMSFSPVGTNLYVFIWGPIPSRESEKNFKSRTPLKRTYAMSLVFPTLPAHRLEPWQGIKKRAWLDGVHFVPIKPRGHAWKSRSKWRQRGSSQLLRPLDYSQYLPHGWKRIAIGSVFSGTSAYKESACSTGNCSSIH